MTASRRLRLLLVSHLFKNPLEHSKLPHLADLAQRLSQEIEVEVVSPVPWVPPFAPGRRWDRLARIPPEHVYGNVRVRYPRHFILPARLWYARGGRRFLQALESTVEHEAFDLMWAHYAYPDGWASVTLGKKTGTPVIVTVRGEDVRSDVDHPGVRRLVEWTLREAHAVTSPHPETTGLVRRLGRKEVVELPNALDVERFSRGDPARIRQELGLEGDFVVTFVGHLVAFKDPRTLLEASARVPPEERIRFLFVGSAGRGREQNGLRSLAGRPGGGNRVHFLGDREDIPDILAASDLFVALSPTENIWSNALLEAMAAGVPCVVTRAGLTEEYLDHGTHAWLVAPRSPEDLAGAIVHLKGNPTLRKELAEGARSLVSATFDLRSVSAQALDLCRRVAGTPR